MAVRGASKSAASRHRLSDEHADGGANDTLSWTNRSFLVLMLYGLEMAGRSVMVTLGLVTDGRNRVLELWQGPTENAALCT